MAILGSCLCGNVRFELDSTDGAFETCHCSRCRKVSGSSSLPALSVPEAGFRFLAGIDAIRSFEAPIMTGPPAYKTFFCGNCGSPTPSPEPGNGHVEIPAGLLDDTLDREPDRHIYVEYTPAWDTQTDTLPRLTREEVATLRS